MLVIMMLAACTNGLNGHHRDDGSRAWSHEGTKDTQIREARRRMGDALRAAHELSKDRDLPEGERERLRRAIANLQQALLEYDRLWAQGEANVVIMASLGTAAGAIVADDVTVIGVMNDWTLVFIAAGAMATHIFTESPASNEELVIAWRRVGNRLQELSIATEHAMPFAAPGNHADTGIMDEAYALLENMGLAITDENICLVLDIMWKNADKARDKKKRKRVETTQKAKKCRHSRHS